MKKYSIISRCLLMAAVLTLINLNTQAQKLMKVEGEVLYTTTMSSTMMPDGMSQQMDLKFKGDKTMMTMETSVPGVDKIVNIIFNDPKEKKTYSFINMNGKKYEMEMTPDDSKNAMKSSPVGAMFNPDSMMFNFIETDTVTKILGHTCHKYRGSTKLISMVVYACDSIYIPSGSLNSVPGSPGVPNMFKGINGGVLKYEMAMTIMGMEITATAVATKLLYQPLSDSEFKMPKGYKKVKYEDLQGLLQSPGN